MPTRKKEILVSSIDAIETTSSDTPELLVTKPVRPARPKRKPAQPKVTTETEIAATSVEPLEQSANNEMIEPTDIIKETSELITDEIEIIPAEEIKESVKSNSINKKQRKETHTKEKFYIRNDLLERLKTLSKGKGKKSFKTTLINDALEKSLNELEATKK